MAFKYEIITAYLNYSEIKITAISIKLCESRLIGKLFKEKSQRPMPLKPIMAGFVDMLEYARVLLSPLIFVGMLLFAVGLREFGSIVLFASLGLLLLYLGAEHFFRDLNADVSICEMAAESPDLASINALGYNISIAGKAQVIETDIGLLEKQLMLTQSTSVRNRSLSLYRSIRRCFSVLQGISYSWLINIYIQLIASHLCRNLMINPHMILVLTITGSSMLGAIISLPLPKAIKKWIGLGGSALSLLGVIIWTIAAPETYTSALNRTGEISRIAQLVCYLSYILYGANLLRAPLPEEKWRDVQWKWLGSGRAVSLLAASLPGIIWYYGATSNIVGILTTTQETIGTIAARICCILGLLGTNMAVLINLYEQNIFPRGFWKATLTIFLLVVSYFIIMLINLIESEALLYLAHAIALIGGGILAPLTAFIMPLFFYADLALSRITRYKRYFYIAMITAFVLLCAGFSQLGMPATFVLPMLMDYNDIEEKMELGQLSRDIVFS